MITLTVRFDKRALNLKLYQHEPKCQKPCLLSRLARTYASVLCTCIKRTLNLYNPYKGMH